MPVQLEHVFSGVRAWRRKEKRDAAVERDTLPITELGSHGAPRRQRRGNYPFDYFADLGTRNADYADAPSPRRGSYRGDNVSGFHGARVYPRGGYPLPDGRAVARPSTRLIFHCCAIESTLFTSQ